MTQSAPKWTKDPREILEVALTWTELEPEFARQLVDRVAAWLEDKPELRVRMNKSLAGHGAHAMHPGDAALFLIRYHELKVAHASGDEALRILAAREGKAFETMRSRRTLANRMRREGSLADWARWLPEG